MTGFALALAILLFLLGLAGVVLPVLPGTILIYAGMILYGLLTGFKTLTANFFLLQGMALVLTFFIDYLAAVVGTNRYGGSRYASWGVIIGAVVGIIFFGPFGFIIGPFCGAVIAEMIFGRKSLEKAIQAGFGTLIGLVGGTILKLIIGLLMIVSFFIAI